MTDNIDVTPGSGATIATDEIGGKHYQIVKLAYGPLDAQQLVDVADGLPVAILGTVPTAEVRANTGTRTIVPASTSSTTILAANALRKSSLLYNNSTSVVYIGLGSTSVSPSDYSFPLGGGNLYEVEYGYTGIIKAAWVTGTGQMRVTEFT